MQAASLPTEAVQPSGAARTDTLENAAADTLRLTHVVGGTVVDGRSRRPLEGVSVDTPSEGYFTVTNRDGVFLIKSDRPVTRITFSCIGYETRTVRLAAGGTSPSGTDPGESADPDNPLYIRLVPSSELLNEAMVVDGDPRAVVLDALERIPFNYPSGLEQFDCFYRETVQKRQRFVSVAEAVTELQKFPYRHHDIHGDRVAVKVGRQLVSPRPGDTLSVKVQGGPAQGVMMDAVKNRGILLDPGELSLYGMELLPPCRIDGRLHFTVRIFPRALLTEYPLYTGLLYIDCETLAFSRMELSLDMSDREKATRMIAEFLLDKHANKDAISKAIKAKESDLVGSMASEGTTPRQLTDLLGSLCDLTSGSGDKGTPIIWIQGYFDNYTM